MILSTCGYDPQRRFTRRGGCGIWVGYGLPYPFAYPFRPVPPYFYRGIAWCRRCAQGLFWVHKGQGIFAWEGPEELREGCEERNPTRGYVLYAQEGDSPLPSRKGEN